jgi:hypothetical protein
MFEKNKNVSSDYLLQRNAGILVKFTFCKIKSKFEKMMNVIAVFKMVEIDVDHVTQKKNFIYEKKFSFFIFEV